MGYLAIARKWRPNRFEDLVGQSHVVQTLKNAIAYHRVTHAYLFSGARGVGKTTVARIFAMALRCPSSKNGIPCTICEECRTIVESRSVDVVEIDGASNNGVEAIRGIRENVAYSASSGTYKIYIIDEVHMLSLSAFNALLKTLEEPPPHVIFVFATTEAHKIPLTILSRCQRFEFRRLTNQQIVGRLKDILGSESLSLTDDALRLLASYGDGSLRDSLSLLDQVLSYYGQEAQGKSLSEKEVVEALGITSTSTVTHFIGSILKKDIKTAVDLIGEIYQGGIDLRRFAERCLEEVRLLYLISLSRNLAERATADNLDISSAHFTQLESLSPSLGLLQLERMGQILGKTISQLSWSSLPRFVLEMATVRMAELDQLSRIEAALAGKQEPSEDEEEVPSENPTKTELMTQPITKDRFGDQTPEKAGYPEPAAKSDHDHPACSSPTEEPGSKSWRAFVDIAMKKRPLLGALLCHGEFKQENRSGKKAAIITFAKGSFYEKQALENKNRAEIYQLFKEYFGTEAQLEISSTSDATINSIEQTRLQEVAALKKEALEHPSVAELQEVLGAEVVDVNVKLEV